MAKELPAGSMFLDRRDLMHSMMAVYVSQLRSEQHMRHEPFTAGYSEGFADALLSMAAAVGVVEEFAAATFNIRKISERRTRTVSPPVR